ncbi:MAG: peptidase BlaR1 [Herbinix sp.]|nr:peptidase BlaR1 [Herbinix sp.]
MRIGEFAEICDTKISVLRHYDKEGLLLPEFIDRITGYRYYSANQVVDFKKITALKQAGFSLKEIKSILSKSDNTKVILDNISRKKTELMRLLSNLEEAKNIMLGAENMQNAIIIENESGVEMRLSVNNPVMNFRDVCEMLEKEVNRLDYQRISGFRTYGERDSDWLVIAVDVIKLNQEVKVLNDNIQIPFEYDDVVGKWEVVGDFAVKDDFYAGSKTNEAFYGDVKKQIYFLPRGERYWCYGWTKGLLIIETGDGTSVNPYEVEEHNGQRYMFIQSKSYYYRRGGMPTVLVLRQLDRNSYRKQDITRYDHIDMPYVPDKNVLGKWKAIYYLRSIEEFDPNNKEDEERLFFKRIEFLEEGNCTSLYGNNTIEGDQMQVWTKGYILRKWDRTACAYELRVDNDKDYLIIEWKSGDYCWGGYDTDYYVFVRDDNKTNT